MFTQEYIEEPDIERVQSDTISVKEELRECFGEIGDVYMDGKKTSVSGVKFQCPRRPMLEMGCSPPPSSVGSNGV